jgi:hypothetical protein
MLLHFHYWQVVKRVAMLDEKLVPNLLQKVFRAMIQFTQTITGVSSTGRKQEENIPL